MMGAGLVFLVLAVAFIFGPWLVPEMMPPLVSIIFMAAGAAFGVIGGLLIIITKLYMKAAADRAFVRTGMGGTKVIMDGGCIVIPVVHTTVEVSLNTLKLVVKRTGPDALITGDKLRADIDAEFYIRVQAEHDDILQAARSLGMRSLSTANVTELVEEKLVSALRSVAAKSDLEQLNTNREQFAQDVADAVIADLKQNGLTLETVTVSSLDQTPIDHFKTDNVFDAEGRRRIAQITSDNSVQENTFRRQAEQEIAEMNAQTREQVAQREYRQAQADAKRDADVARARSEQQRSADVYIAEQLWQTSQAQLTAEQSIGERAAEKDREVRLAQIGANQAAESSDVRRAQVVEVTEREREVAVARAEQLRAEARAEQLKAEQQREAEAQRVITVEAVQSADRQKEVQVIAAQQSAEVARTGQFMEADINAYQAAKIAEGERDAAVKHAEAIRTRATAERDARTLEATGEQAVQMVPVNVSAEQVNVDARRQTEVEMQRVHVLRQELEAQDAHQQIAFELQRISRLLEAVQAIGVEQAKAVGAGLSQAELTFFGDPKMMEQFATRFGAGVSVNGLLQGLLGGDGQQTEETLSGLGQALQSVLQGIGSQKPSPQLSELTERINELLKQFGAAPAQEEAGPAE